MFHTQMQISYKNQSSWVLIFSQQTLTHFSIDEWCLPWLLNIIRFDSHGDKSASLHLQDRDIVQNCDPRALVQATRRERNHMGWGQKNMVCNRWRWLMPRWESVVLGLLWNMRRGIVVEQNKLRILSFPLFPQVCFQLVQRLAVALRREWNKRSRVSWMNILEWLCGKLEIRLQALRSTIFNCISEQTDLSKLSARWVSRIGLLTSEL